MAAREDSEGGGRPTLDVTFTGAGGGAQAALAQIPRQGDYVQQDGQLLRVYRVIWLEGLTGVKVELETF